MRFWKSAFALGISSVTLMVAYQNCAQSPGVEPGSQHVDVEIDYPVYALGTEESTSAKVDSRTCELQRLHCLRKVYSPAVEDLQTEEIHCLDETAAQHCLKVNSVYYNTSFGTDADCERLCLVRHGYVACAHSDFACWSYGHERSSKVHPEQQKQSDCARQPRALCEQHHTHGDPTSGHGWSAVYFFGPRNHQSSGSLLRSVFDRW